MKAAWRHVESAKSHDARPGNGERPLLSTHRCGLSTSACGRRRPGAVLQTPAPSNAFHGVATKTRVHCHIPELEHRPAHHPIGRVEWGATGHPCTTAQMERPTSYSLSLTYSHSTDALEASSLCLTLNNTDLCVPHPQ